MAAILGTDRVEILALARAGHKPEAIALAYPYSAADIRHLVMWQRGTDLQARKLDQALADEIRRRVAQGESVNSLAASLRVHRNTIGRVLAGLTWRG